MILTFKKGILRALLPLKKTLFDGQMVKNHDKDYDHDHEMSSVFVIHFSNHDQNHDQTLEN